MAKNRLDDLRNHLFETLERLKDVLIRSQSVDAISRAVRAPGSFARWMD